MPFVDTAAMAASLDRRLIDAFPGGTSVAGLDFLIANKGKALRSNQDSNKWPPRASSV